ncbi:hypothetical protein EV1_021343 [Malus domestica]
MVVYDPAMSTCSILQPHHDFLMTPIQSAAHLRHRLRSPQLFRRLPRPQALQVPLLQLLRPLLRRALRLLQRLSEFPFRFRIGYSYHSPGGFLVEN